MCTTCGCGVGETRIEGEGAGDEHAHEHAHVAADGTVYRHVHASVSQGPAPRRGHLHRHADGTLHRHAQGQPQGHLHDHAHGEAHQHADGAADSAQSAGGPAGAHAPGMAQARLVQIERDILAKNDAYAADNRKRLDELGVFALNLVSSPGSGKTSLLVRTILALKSKLPLAVIEGDQQTSFDAERIRATGARAIQINTGKGCHLDAQMVGRALERLALAEGSALMIENVGNLVCPAAFDLGEAHKVVVLSVTEGEDKPLKYPDMFRAASLMLLNKADLLPHLSFDADLALDYAHRVNPDLQVIRTSATTGEGFDDWLAWIEQGVAAQRARRAGRLAAREGRITELEAEPARLTR